MCLYTLYVYISVVGLFCYRDTVKPKPGLPTWRMKAAMLTYFL